jgi:hypothetical protein
MEEADSSEALWLSAKLHGVMPPEENNRRVRILHLA